MAAKFRKVVAALPDPLEPDTLYFVRVGTGFDVYVSDATGSIAHTLNLPAGAQQQVYVQATQPIVPPGIPYIWIQTGLGADGTEKMFFVEDGT